MGPFKREYRQHNGRVCGKLAPLQKTVSQYHHCLSFPYLHMLGVPWLAEVFNKQLRLENTALSEKERDGFSQDYYVTINLRIFNPVLIAVTVNAGRWVMV